MINTKQKAFTLVELIVVIVILAILATIAFLSFSSQSSSARDSTRLSDISNIAKWLLVFNATAGKYPIPNNYISINASWAQIWMQWYAGASVLNMIKLSNWWKDPLDWTTYTYLINSGQNKFQIMWFLEDWNNAALSFVPFKWNEANADASSYSGRYVYSKWDTLGILLDSQDKSPLQSKYNASSFTWVDIVNTTSNLIVQFSNKDYISWSWSNLVAIKQTYATQRDISLVWSWDMETWLPNWTLADLSWNWNNWTASWWIILWWTNWKYSKATYFDWINDIFNAWSWNNLNITNALTLYAWVNINKSWDFKLISKSPSNTDWKFQLWTIVANKASFWIKSTTWNSVNWNTTLQTWVWYHLCGTYDGSKIKIFVNGVQDNSTSMTGAIASSTGDTLWIWSNWNTTQFLSWSLDDLWIYNRALSDLEVQNMYNSTK
ncbi:MAG: LamG protein [uncultured bacterium (gcode 4)]|uniref:LamG protein n=1 Tax=uncultured bacterium (gcode 4) TaxID=1234023 RepID=K2FCM9_9BACT|nr:MAG: LamG protein [uncultured bacterium (gcode 4)]